MSAAPDFCEPVLGYRAWHLAEDGVLRPWTFSGLPWSPGVNTAVCARVPGHRPPVADCSCGLYALSGPGDRRLDFHGDQAIGAIAAWGELEVHRTGFRAQHACVVALAVPERADDELLERLSRAAERHRVALVPAAGLSAEARRHGAPLPDLWPEERGRPGRAARHPGPAAPPIDPAVFAQPARGLVPDAHLWVETGLGCVVVGLTPQLAAALGGEARAELAEPGARVAAGDRLGTVHARAGSFAVWAPVSGRVLASGRLGPDGGGWLARLLPDDWARDGAACSWGPAAPAAYEAELARGGDPFADVRLERLRAVPPVSSWGDVLAVLRQERRRERFPDAEAVRREIVEPVRATLRDDERLRRCLGRLDRRVAFAVPEEALVLDLRGGDARVLGSGALSTADLRLACTAEVLDRWLTGTLDPAAALRRGDLRSDRPLGETLRALAVLKHLRLARRPAAPSWERAYRSASTTRRTPSSPWNGGGHSNVVSYRPAQSDV